MSFYHLPHPWNPGYAIPKYVLAEPPERGTFTTRWLPRGTISSLVPDYLAKPGRPLLGRRDADLGSLDGTVFDGHSLAGHSLAGHSLEGSTLRSGKQVYRLEPLGNAATPPVLAQYGQRSASAILQRLHRVAPARRTEALRTLLDAIDQRLLGEVEARAARYRAAGAAGPVALQRALAESLSSGMVREVAEVATRVARGAARPVARRGQLGLAAYNATGDWWDTIKEAASDVKEFAEDAAKYVKKGACAALANGQAKDALAYGTGRLGVPEGVAQKGLDKLSDLCGKGSSKKPAPAKTAPAAAPSKATFVPPPPKSESSASKWVLPAVGAGAALLLLGAG